jgi:hypothetical protein
MADEVLLRGAGRELVALSATLFEDMNPAWLLLTKNLRTRRPSKGLDNVKVGPFLILEQIGPVTYTLNLPPDVKVHPRFHVSLLEPADPSTPLQKTIHFQMEEDNEFEVETIIAHRDADNGREYIVKWKGYPDSDDTWEPDTNLQNCQQLLQKYKKETRHYQESNPGLPPN